MGLRNWTWKIFALYIVGSLATVLFMISVARLWKHEFQTAMWSFALSAALTLIFFRRRKIAFATVALSFICVNVGFTALFHPTKAGIFLTLASIVGMYALAIWGAKKYPHLKRKDWKTLFDRDPEM